MQINKNNSISDFTVYLILLLIGIIYFIEAIHFPGSFEGGDGMRHYLVSRFSWKHPEQFLYLWGKPFFTLISSPFSQAGLIGIKIFNALCALSSGLLVYKICKKLMMNNSWMAVIFMAFTPIFYFATNSGYTEIFFGLCVILTIYHYICGKYFWSTILISFLPFVRSEGYLLLPLFFLILIINKKYLIIPLLAFGNVAYSIAGYFYYHDLFWLYTQNPYDGHMSEIYGHGPLLHFINYYEYIWGKPLGILICLGLVSPIIRLIKRDDDKPFFTEEIILIFGSAIVYFVAHSIFWWKGWFNSLGLTRVMAAIAPFLAIISLRGFNLIITYIPWKFMRYTFMLIILFFVIRNPYKKQIYPLQLEAEEQVVLKLKTWYEKSKYNDKNYTIVYLHPYMPEALSFDPFDPKRVIEFWAFYPTIKKYGYSAIPDSTIVFWDAHYANREAMVPFDTLLNDSHFQLIKTINPEVPFKSLGGIPFSINVFVKSDSVSYKIDTLASIIIDFESEKNIENNSTITSGTALSGTKSSEYSVEKEFGAAVSIPSSEIKDKDKIMCVSFQCKIKVDKNPEAVAVLSFHKNDKQVGYYNIPIVVNSEKKEWQNFSTHWRIDNEQLIESDHVKVYLWNKNRRSFFADDFEIRFMTNCPK